MTRENRFAIHQDFADLSRDPAIRHEAFVDYFGQFLFWIRNWSIRASRKFIESTEEREKLGTVRREPYEGVARMSREQRDAAMSLVEETVNGFSERLVWFLGGQSNDLRLGGTHAVRFHIDMEIVDVESDEVVLSERISSGGQKFFGSYWGRWLNRHRDK
jgi:hypothetical protein